MGFVYRGVYCDISRNFGDFRILYYVISII